MASQDEILERRKRLYRKQLDGDPLRHLIYQHCENESIQESTAWADWKEVKKWTQEDWLTERESAISRIQSLRFRTIERALRNKNYSVVRELLLDIGKVVNEASETINLNAPQLSINVEKKQS